MNEISVTTETNEILVQELSQNVVVADPNVVVTDADTKIVQAANPNIIQVVTQDNVVYAPILEANIISVGMQGPPGTSGGALVTEIPDGVIDGANLIFNLAHPPQAILLFLNGLALQKDNDYSVASNVITFVEDARPWEGDALFVLYAY